MLAKLQFPSQIQIWCQFLLRRVSAVLCHAHFVSCSRRSIDVVVYYIVVVLTTETESCNVRANCGEGIKWDFLAWVGKRNDDEEHTPKYDIIRNSQSMPGLCVYKSIVMDSRINAKVVVVQSSRVVKWYR